MGMDDGLMARYGSDAGAAAYRDKYEKSWLRRRSGARERSLLRRALHESGTHGVVLDVPCGAGRLVPTILEVADRVTALDLSPAMVEQARGALAREVAEGRVVIGTGSALELPFEDQAFDTVVCWRLVHHLVEKQDRARLLRELSRVARRAVVLTFADSTTWKARWLSLRGRTRRCVRASPEELRIEAEGAGLELQGTRRLAGLFSLLACARFHVNGGKPAAPARPSK